MNNLALLALLLVYLLAEYVDEQITKPQSAALDEYLQTHQNKIRALRNL